MPNNHSIIRYRLARLQIMFLWQMEYMPYPDIPATSDSGFTHSDNKSSYWIRYLLLSMSRCYTTSSLEESNMKRNTLSDSLEKVILNIEKEPRYWYRSSKDSWIEIFSNEKYKLTIKYIMDKKSSVSPIRPVSPFLRTSVTPRDSSYRQSQDNRYLKLELLNQCITAIIIIELQGQLD